MADETHIKVADSNGVRVIEFCDRKILDELSISELGSELKSAVDDQPGARTLLNFRNVEHLSSAALGMLITLDKQIKDQKGILKLSNINPQIYEVFKITRLNKLFDIHDSAEKALASF